MKCFVFAAAVFAASAAAAQSGGGEKAFIRESQARIEAQLKDPGSVQYRNLFVSKQQGDDALFLCGEVNAKNAYGGYVGFRQFISAPGERQLAYLGSQIAALWPEYCGDPVRTIR